MSTRAKRVEDMTPEERLESLKQWAEEQKYVRPGEGGTLPCGVRGVQSLAYGGPVHYVEPQYKAPIAPPSYETAVREATKSSKQKSGPLSKWREKRKERKASEAGSYTNYTSARLDLPPAYSGRRSSRQ